MGGVISSEPPVLWGTPRAALRFRVDSEVRTRPAPGSWELGGGHSDKHGDIS